MSGRERYAGRKGSAGELMSILLNHAKDDMGFTDLKLSQRSGVARSSISTMRAGKSHANLAQFLAICDALAVEPYDAIQGYPQGSPPERIRIGKHTYTLTKESKHV